MTTSQTNQTTTVGNCRIYICRTGIKKLKDFWILKGEICLLYLPIADDIMKVFSSDKLEKTSEKLNFRQINTFQPSVAMTLICKSTGWFYVMTAMT